MNEHKNIITIEDEIKEFSDKPVKSSALFKALEEKGVPDSSEASVGDVLSLDEDKKPTWAAPSGGGGVLILTPPSREITQIEGGRVVRLCSVSEVMDASDPTTGAFTKAVFINLPFVVGGMTEWEAIFGCYHLETMADPLTELEGQTVWVVVNGSDLYLKYTSK